MGEVSEGLSVLSRSMVPAMPLGFTLVSGAWRSTPSRYLLDVLQSYLSITCIDAVACTLVISTQDLTTMGACSALLVFAQLMQSKRHICS